MVSTLKGDVAIFEDFVSQGTCPGHVSVPVHIVGGGADASVPSDALRAWKQLVSNATLTIIEDAGHFHTETHPEEICKLLAKTCHAWYHSQPSSIIHGPYRVYEEEKYCVHELFEQQAARTPDAIMVVDFNEALTFAQARTRSRLIARTLQASGVGVNMEGIVGVLCPPSANFLVAQLGINMAGGAILPFYTNYSKSLIEDLIRTANVAYFICSASYAHLIPDSMQGTSLVLAQGWSERLESEETLPAYVRPDVSPADIAMLAMTSGSTGKPKAIIVSHRATAISFAIRYEKFPFTDTDVIASNIFFVWEALRGPLRGRPVHVIPDDVVVDPKRFVRFLRDCAATRIVVTAQLTSNMLNYPNLDLVADLASMRMWMLCGEVCLRSMARQWTTRAPASAQLYNFYSSWESLDVSYVELPLADTSVSASRFAVAASEPLPNVSIYILDENMQPVPKGIIGETYIGNRGLSDGYLNDDVKNAKHFLPNHLKDRDDFFQMHSETPSVTNKLYRTGDRARILPGWQLEIAGRGDSIVKIRGFKVGLHYVESQLKLVSGVRDAVVRPVLDEESRQPEALVAYITGDSGRPSSDACVQVAESVKAMVPAYAAPAFIIGLETFPTRPGSGKRDFKKFPAANDPANKGFMWSSKGKRTAVASSRRSKNRDDSIALLLKDAWREVLGSDGFDEENDNFFEVGGHSLKASKLAGLLTDTYGIKVAVLDVYSNPTISALAGCIRSRMGSDETSNISVRSKKERPRRGASVSGSMQDIAVIGIAGRFPGAGNVDEFWSNLTAGRDSLRTFSTQELRSRGVPDSLLSHPDFVPVGQVVDNPDHFDAYFFGIGASEAKLMDPQQRLFLQTAWHALENAGYAPRSGTDFNTGVFAACGIDGYLVNHLDGGKPLKDASKPGQIFKTEVGNEKDYIATRVSYQLDLGGPSFTVNSACSSGLVAVAQAAQAILSGDCDVAVAGASSLTFPNFGYLYSEGLVGSKDGHVRPFDAEASGTLFGDGIGAVVLKRMDHAIEDGDHIWGVVKGSAVTNDGREKAGYAAPSAKAQQRAIQTALQRARVTADTITYVECHATATHVGDAIEMSGLVEAFREGKSKGDPTACALGSVKGNIGHANCAAGITGFIKTILCLHHKKLVPTANYSTLNKKIDFTGTGFYVNEKYCEWEATSQYPLRAGVSSFGVGGTNAHIVLEEAPGRANADAERAISGDVALIGSAKTKAAAEAYASELASYFDSGVSHNLRDVAHTLAVGREAFRFRFAVTASSYEQAATALKSKLAISEASSASGVVFAFPGQGSQYPRMGKQLYESNDVFRMHVDACCAVVGDHLLAHIFSDDDDALQKPSIVQPAIFTIEYSLAKTLMDFGVQPVALCGHSIGEYVAATISGVFDLSVALRLIVERGMATESLAKGGAMLSIKMEKERVQALLKEYPGVAVAAHNAPKYFVMSGSEEMITKMQDDLMSKGLRAVKLHVNRAFHSNFMNEAATRLESFLSSQTLAPPSIPMTSNVTGGWLDEDDALSPQYWGKHMRQTVRFKENVDKVIKWKPTAIIEIGPGSTLSKLISKCLPLHTLESAPLIVQTMRHPKDNLTSDSRALSGALCSLWSAGVRIDWNALFSGARRVPVPGYCFEKVSHWVNPEASIYVPIPIERAKHSNRRAEAAAKIPDKRLVSLLALSGAPLVVFAFPYAGGSSRIFQPWVERARALGGISIVGVELPGRGVRSEETVTMTVSEDTDEIEAISTAIANYMRFIPSQYILVGYSMGGLFAARVAANLGSDSKFAGIAIAGRAPPPLDDISKSIAVPIDDDAIAAYNLIPPSKVNSEVWQNHFLPLLKRDLECDGRLAASLHAGSLTNVHFHICCAMEDPSFAWTDAVKWQNLGGSALRVHLYPGGHEFLRDSTTEIFSDILAGFAAIWASASIEDAAEEDANGADDVSILSIEWVAPNAHASSLSKRADTEMVVVDIIDRPLDVERIISKAKSGATIVVRPQPAPLESDVAKFNVTQCWRFVELAQALIAAEAAARIVVACQRDSDCGAMIAGASRTLEMEFPDLRCVRVFAGADTTPKSLTRACDLYHSESDIKICKDGTLLVRRAAIVEDSARSPSRIVLRESSNGVYIVTGGTGGIGRELVRWLINIQRIPPERIILLTRRAPAHDVYGARAIVCDVSEPNAMSSSALDDIQAVDGIFHLAGCLQDGIISRLSGSSFSTVAAPKVAGLLSLVSACTSRGWKAPWIAAFSSTTSLLGYPGQANYAAANAFIDARASMESDIPIIALNWGPWGEVGMAKEGSKAYAQAIKGGEIPLRTDEALRGLEEALRQASHDSSVRQFCIARVVWDKSVWRGHSLIEDLRSKEAAPFITADIGRSETSDAIEKFLTERVSKFDVNATLGALGVDSLDEVQLRNDFVRLFGVSAPLSTFVMPNQTLGTLADNLRGLIA